MTDELPLNKENIVKGLADLGLKRGDVVLMHSDLRSLARPRELLAAPDAGMGWLVEAFREVLGPEGILAVPTFTSTFVTKRKGPAGLVWDPATTPSRVGQITNYVRQLPDARRSDHPTHSVAAIGDRAEWFVSGHSWRDGATTFDRNGPWGHLVDEDGSILWLGTDMRTQTCVHVVEDWMRLPYMATGKARVNVDGETQEATVTQSPAGPRDFYKKDSKSAAAWEAAGLATKSKVCHSNCQIMKARVFVDWLWNALLEDPCLLLHDDPSPEDAFTIRAREETPKHLASFEGTWRRE